MAMTAAYLTPGAAASRGTTHPKRHGGRAESSCGRQSAPWGAMDFAELIERNCLQAKLFADRLRGAGFSILNDVVLNQVLVSFGSDEDTLRVIAEYPGRWDVLVRGTQWHRHTAMRISVSSWATTNEDVERSVAAMIRIASQGLIAT